MNKTSIEWCIRPETRGADGARTWNPIRARLKGASPKAHSGTFCTRISPGCQLCWASTINKRFGNGLEFTVPNLEKIEFFVDERILHEPLKQKKPCTIFVGDMFDLFHEAIPTTMLDEVFTVAAVCKHHTFQFLTKRADRMRDYLRQIQDDEKDLHRWQALACMITDSPCAAGLIEDLNWPIPNIWCGVSVEDQQRADERIPLLLQTPAAVRFLSVEPMLEEIDLTRIPLSNNFTLDALTGIYGGGYPDNFCSAFIDWVICGGESGPGARHFNLAWAESIREQCRAAKTAFFMKQIGSNPIAPGRNHGLACTVFPNKRSKGGDMSEWPEHLRVREFPKVREAVTA